jgi:hypothetical protein
VNVPAILAAAALVVGAAVTGLMALLVNRRTTKGNVATATAADVLNAFDRLQIGQRAEMNRMQAVIDVLRPALAEAENSGALKATEIIRLHGLIDALEISIKALRGGLEGAVA